MFVREMMQTNIKTIAADAPVQDAIMLMADEHISGLPVIDRDEQLLGVLSTTDVLSSISEVEDPQARYQLLEDKLVEELMTPLPRTIAQDAELEDAAQKMLYFGVHRLFVIDESDRLVGVISQTDIVRAVATTRI